MQLCPTYKKEMTPEWFKNHSEDISTVEGYQRESLPKVEEFFAKKKNDKIYTGILCKINSVKTFYENLENRKGYKTNLVEEVKQYSIKNLLKKFE